MPEGDTIFRAAATLRRALEGCVLTEVALPRVVGEVPRAGETVTAVEARGKHLTIRFSGGLELHTHMKMTGSWHLYRPGEPWRKRPSLVRAKLATADWVAVCFAAPVVEIVRPAGARTARPTDHLGPDLCVPPVDVDECVARMDRFADPTDVLADVLLDQRIACGVGNVYKSEVLWRCQVSPWTRLADLDVATRRRLIAESARLLQANLVHSARVTVPEIGGLGVYGRSGQPCVRCGTPIEYARRGDQARSTYWCPTCQPAAGGAAPA